ncbi:hypothetical protein KR038_003965, partial [Drosophila bunnanda]
KMCWKFSVPLKIIVAVSLLLAAMADASQSYDGNKHKKSLCQINHQMAAQVAAETATAATAAMDADGPATDHMKLVLAKNAEEAAAAASDIMVGKKNELDVLAKRLIENQKAIEEGDRAMGLARCALKRVLWIRESTRQGLENMMHMYNESRGAQDEINSLADFARQEEAEKAKLLKDASRRLDSLKNGMKLAQEELESIRKSAKEANLAADNARERVDLLRKLAPEIRKLNGKQLQ